ncbi:MAG TPA: hypothetical protein VEP49_18215 [Acidimicrobiia bacterium]|nr:hypothetical protein [Acidimicrobiia bacterium]
MKSLLHACLSVLTLAALGSVPAVAATSDHALHGTLDTTAELVAPPTEGACGAALADSKSSTAQVVAACSNDPHYVEWIAATAKGAKCSSDDATIRTGTQVVVRNAKHELVALTHLGTGIYTKDQGDVCRFGFTTKVPDSRSYEVEVGDQGFVTFSEQQLQRHAWYAPLRVRG